ncbi:sigma factor [Actinomadura nitritigenes]|uniref:sigma factor n=1 Tax=Actinomadura nitritigenes TaxID=134602 RepID=UPI003D8B0AA0
MVERGAHGGRNGLRRVLPRDPSGLVAELYAYTGGMAEAQDIVQEASTRAWSRWGRLQSYDQLRAWVARGGYRLAVSRWRRARTGLTAMRCHGPPPADAAPSEASVAPVAALRQIPARSCSTTWAAIRWPR